MTMWFGESWDAPVNEGCPQTETPVGEKCVYCVHPIEQGDRGVVVPFLSGKGSNRQMLNSPYHLRCWLLSVCGTKITEMTMKEIEDRG